MIQAQPISFGIFGPPAPVVDNAIAAFDETTGRKIQSRAVTIDDSGNLVLPANAAIGVTDGNPQIVFDDANNWLEITADRTGFGTPTPGATIHVHKGTSGGTVIGDTGILFEDDGNMFIQQLVPDNSTSGYYFGGVTDHDAGRIFYGNVDSGARPNAMSFFTAGDEVVRFHGSGGVSIGDNYIATDPLRNNLIVENNLGLGATTFGASMAGGLAFALGTEPTGDVANQFAFWGKDQAVGNTAPALRTENGAVIHLFQALKANYNNWAALGDVVDALVAIGLLDQA